MSHTYTVTKFVCFFVSSHRVFQRGTKFVAEVEAVRMENILYQGILKALDINTFKGKRPDKIHTC